VLGVRDALSLVRTI
jgi:hypothetical protein